MKLIAAGDSFTWGNDLPDSTPEKYSRLAWGSLLAAALGWDYECVAVPGGSNRAIERQCLAALVGKKDLAVAVMWTYPHRLETKLWNTAKEDYSTVSHWHAATIEEKFSNWPSMDAKQRKFFLREHEENERSGLSSVSKVLSENLHDDYYYSETLRSQCMLADYLESHDIPYVFMLACDTARVSNMPTKDSYVELLKQKISKANWLEQPMGFIEWATDNNFATGVTKHPLQDAHIAFVSQHVLPAVANWRKR